MHHFKDSLMKEMMRPCVGGKLILAPDLRYVYVTCPKCGCTTIKNTLLLHERKLNPSMDEIQAEPADIHRDMPLNAEDEDLMNLYQLDAMPFVFTVVRNPYARILSAYLDKIHYGYKTLTCHFEKLYWVDVLELSFVDFLKKLKDSDQDLVNIHFRPVTGVVGIGEVQYEYVGKLEDMNDFQNTVLCRLFGQDSHLFTCAPHKKNAAKKLQRYYSDEAVELVNEIYRDDFLLFQYTMNDFDDMMGGEVDLEMINHESKGCFFGFSSKELFGISCQYRECLKNDDLDGAIGLVERAMSIDPNNAYYYRLKGVLLQRQNDLDGAMEAYRKSLAYNDSCIVHYEFSQIYFEKGLLRESIHELELAVKNNTLNPGRDNMMSLFYEKLSECYMQLGRPYRDNIEMYERVLKSRKSFEDVWIHSDVYYKLGIFYAREKKYDEAIDKMLTALSIDPDNEEYSEQLDFIIATKKSNSHFFSKVYYSIYRALFQIFRNIFSHAKKAEHDGY